MPNVGISFPLVNLIVWFFKKEKVKFQINFWHETWHETIEFTFGLNVNSISWIEEKCFRQQPVTALMPLNAISSFSLSFFSFSCSLCSCWR